MGVRFYDQAVADKIQKWVANPNLRVLKPEETTRLFQMTADQLKDKPITLPLLAIARDPNVELKQTTKNAMSCEGVRIVRSEKQTIKLNVIPISIAYQLDIYTKRFEEGDEFVRNLTFSIMNHPAIKVAMQYNGVNIEHIAYMKLDSTLRDNSDIKEKLFPDQFTRWTIKFVIDDAYYFSVPINKNWKVDAELITDDETLTFATEEDSFKEEDISTKEDK